MISSFVVALSACGATTYDDSRVTTSAAPTTTTLPTGTTAELLQRLADELDGLSTLIGPRADNETVPDGNKRARLAEITALWVATEADMTADDPDGAETIGRMIDLATLAVERNRPADADKAAKFTRIVVDAYIARWG
ncbi:MAG: hypothetical protein ACKODY_11550 [Actinomycetota bacterium]